jgi:hypothetical protein
LGVFNESLRDFQRAGTSGHFYRTVKRSMEKKQPHIGLQRDVLYNPEVNNP